MKTTITHPPTYMHSHTQRTCPCTDPGCVLQAKAAACCQRVPKVAGIREDTPGYGRQGVGGDAEASSSTEGVAGASNGAAAGELAEFSQLRYVPTPRSLCILPFATLRVAESQESMAVTQSSRPSGASPMCVRSFCSNDGVVGTGDCSSFTSASHSALIWHRALSAP